jgi:primosomal protein N' (replication factor Y)
MASVTGASDAVADFVGLVGLPDHAEVLGPVPAYSFPARSAGHPEQPAEPKDPPGPQERALIRIGRGEGLALARALHAAQATRSARKDGAAVRVQLDPAEVA